jgi:hypothetical protein
MKAGGKKAELMRRFEYFDGIADDNVKQAVAMCLYSFWLEGYRKKRIQKLYDQFLGVIEMPPSVLGRDINAEDAMCFLEDKCGIDFGRIKIHKEGRTQYMKRKAGK